MFTLIRQFDHFLFLLINGFNNAGLDVVMYWASNRFIWIPFYAGLLFLVVKNEPEKKRLMYFIPLAAMLVLCSDQLSVLLFKETVHRLRPCHSLLAPRVHLIGSCGGMYGFVSSHASNVFGIASFLYIILRNKVKGIGVILFAWATLVAYSRVYLGVHYPVDVVCGGVFGAAVGNVFGIAWYRFKKSQIRNA